jgi:predicted MFS family arabinose efflux permease
MLFAIGPSLLGNAFHGRERATAFSVFGAATGLAAAGGPLIGGSLINAESWRWIFYINIPVGILAIVATQLKVPESRARRPHPVDVAGMATFSVALVSLVFAGIRGNEVGWSSPEIFVLCAVFVVFLAVFAAVELRLGERAMIDLGLFRNRTFLGVSLVALIGTAAALPSIFILTNYLENLIGSSAWSAGLRFLPLTFALLLSAAISGTLIGKVPFRILMGFSSLALGAGLALVQLVGPNSAWTALIPSMIVMGVGMGVFSPTRAALAIGVTEPARSGIASGISETLMQVGTALGIAGMGAFFQGRVASYFATSAATASATTGSALNASAVHSAGLGIAAGYVNAAPAAVGHPGQPALLAAARDSFIAGFHDTMWFCAAIAFVSALLAFAMLRTQDLHSSALSLVPPEIEEPEDSEPEPEAEAKPEVSPEAVGSEAVS